MSFKVAIVGPESTEKPQSFSIYNPITNVLPLMIIHENIYLKMV